VISVASVPNRHHEIGARIRRLRLSTGISQERFAPRIGITRRHLVRLENGEHRPGRELAARIEQVVEEITGKPPRERVLPDDEEDESDQMIALDLLTVLRRALQSNEPSGSLAGKALGSSAQGA